MAAPFGLLLNLFLLLLGIILAAALVLGLLLAIRRGVLWYLRIDEQIEETRKTNTLLEQVLAAQGQSADSRPSSQSGPRSASVDAPSASED